MSDRNTTTIEIDRDVWRRLNKHKDVGDSFNDVVEKLLDSQPDYNRVSHPNPTINLNELEEGSVNSEYGQEMFDFVYESLHEADELKTPLCWQTGVWESCSVEELIGGILGAKAVIEDYRKDMAMTEIKEQERT